MLRRHCFALVVLSTFLASGVLGADRLPPAAQWMPQDTVLALEVTRPKAILDLAIGEKMIQAVSSLPSWEKIAGSPQFGQLRQVIDYLEGRLDTDWQPGLHKLLDGGITLGVTPKRGVLLIIDAEEGPMLAKLHDIVRLFTASEAEKHGRREQVKSEPYQGVTTWTFNANDHHAVLGNRLVIANRPELLKAVLDLRVGKGGRSLADVPQYRDARKAASDTAANLFVNVAAIKQVAPLKKALAAGQNPMGALLFAGLLDVLRDANWVVFGLRVDGDRLTLEGTTDAKIDPRAGVAAFTWPQTAGEGAMPGLSVPRQIAGLSFYRDLHGFYAAKDKLFPERTSGLIFFENMMGIFFSGRDLTEEVLGETLPEIRLVVAGQQYDSAVAVPHVQVPAFAAVFRLKDPKKFYEVAEEAWQKAVGLVNITSGQKGQPGLVIDRATHGDSKYSVAYYRTASIEDKKQAPVQYNFRPALALAGDRLIVSSTDGLVCDLIDAISKETAAHVKPVAGTHTLASLDLVQLGSVLAANREHLVRQNMVEKGNSQSQAEVEIDLLLTVLKHAGQTKLAMGSRDGRAHATLEMKLNLPK